MVGIGKLLQGAELLAEISYLSGQFVTPRTQTIKLATRFNVRSPVGTVYHASQERTRFVKVLNLRSLSNESHVDAFCDEHAGAVEPS
jgi:hypothetical protein